MDSEYPKFVLPHPSHVVRDPRNGKPHVEKWEYYRDRDDSVTVLVNDAEEESAALADANADAEEEFDVPKKEGFIK